MFKPPDKAYWEQLGYDDLMASLDTTSKTVADHAKNVIIFVGDGMSLPTVTAARYITLLFDSAKNLTKSKTV